MTLLYNLFCLVGVSQSVLPIFIFQIICFFLHSMIMFFQYRIKSGKVALRQHAVGGPVMISLSLIHLCLT